MKALGILLIIVGFLFSLSGIGSLIGVPLIIGGIVSFFYPIFSAAILVGLVIGHEAGAQTNEGYFFAIAITAAILIPLKHFVFDKLGENDPLVSFLSEPKKDTPEIQTTSVKEVFSQDDEGKIWETAFNEANDESKRVPSIWAKAFAESLGDEKKAAAIYIKLRVENLNTQIVIAPTDIHKSPESLLTNNQYQFKKIDGFDCFFFPNGQCSVKDGEAHVLFNNSENLHNSIRNYGYTGMHDSRGQLRTIRNLSI
jgi:hypothetical protein